MVYRVSKSQQAQSGGVPGFVSENLKENMPVVWQNQFLAHVFLQQASSGEARATGAAQWVWSESDK